MKKDDKKSIQPKRSVVRNAFVQTKGSGGFIGGRKSTVFFKPMQKKKTSKTDEQEQQKSEILDNKSYTFDDVSSNNAPIQHKTDSSECRCPACQLQRSTAQKKDNNLHPKTDVLSSVSTIKQRSIAPVQKDDSVLGELRSELDSTFNVDEELVIRLMGRLDAAGKNTVLTDPFFKNKAASALNVGEMVRAMINLAPPLATQLEWVKAASLITSAIDYSEIRPLITRSAPTDKNTLKNNTWRDFFTSVCTNETIVTALNDLGFDLVTKLDWLKAELFSARLELEYAVIQPWIVTAPQIERDALKTDAWKGFFVETCTNATMIQALTDLNFDLVTKLTWLQAELFSARIELDYGTIAPWITAAPQAQRDALKTDIWRNFFIETCNNSTILTALQDLNFPLKDRISWCWHEGGLGLIEKLIKEATQADRDAVWQDDAYLRSLRTLLGSDNDYLWVIVWLRMYTSGTNTMTTALNADQAITRHLAGYVKGAVDANRQVSGMVAVVDGWNWDVTGQYTFGAQWATKKTSLNGFVDDEGRVWINPNQGNIGTMIHEAIHKYSADTVRGTCWNLNEGMTEYFTRLVMTAESMNMSVRASIYANQHLLAKQLSSIVSEATMAACFFDGDNDSMIAALKAAKGDDSWDNFVTAMNADDWTTATAAIA